MRRFGKGKTVVALIAVVLFSMDGCIGLVDDEAGVRLQRNLDTMSIMVFPAFSRDGKVNRYDTEAAAAPAGFFLEDNLATVVSADDAIPIPGPWHMTQARMLRQSAAAFAAYLKEHPV